MEGWNTQDIATHYAVAYTTVDTWFRRAVRKIVAANDAQWREFYGKSDSGKA